MQATELTIPDKIFNFSGQTRFDTWKLREVFEKVGWSGYSDWLVDELPFCMQRIRELADAFPFWQRSKNTGRPAYPAKVHYRHRRHWLQWSEAIMARDAISDPRNASAIELGAERKTVEKMRSGQNYVFIISGCWLRQAT